MVTGLEMDPSYAGQDANRIQHRRTAGLGWLRRNGVRLHGPGWRAAGLDPAEGTGSWWARKSSDMLGTCTVTQIVLPGTYGPSMQAGWKIARRSPGATPRPSVPMHMQDNECRTTMRGLATYAAHRACQSSSAPDTARTVHPCPAAARPAPDPGEQSGCNRVHRCLLPSRIPRGFQLPCTSSFLRNSVSSKIATRGGSGLPTDKWSQAHSRGLAGRR